MLKPGDPAPPFKGQDTEGNERSLEDYRGKKLVLYFYPKDDTPGCTKEACSMRDHNADIQAKGAEVVHLGHNRSVREVVETAIQEDAQGIAISSYQGGHNEYFRYILELLEQGGLYAELHERQRMEEELEAL